MEEIAKIISAIESALYIDKVTLLTGKGFASKMGRKIMCHIANAEYMINAQDLATITGLSFGGVSKILKKAEELSLCDVSYIRHLNKVRAKLKLPLLPPPAVKKEKAVKTVKDFVPDKPEPTPYYKSPLGFIYTDLDELKMRANKNAAARFIENFGTGVQPLVEGYAIKRKKPCN